MFTTLIRSAEDWIAGDPVPMPPPESDAAAVHDDHYGVALGVECAWPVPQPRGW